jgi:hypothetical protein
VFLDLNNATLGSEAFIDLPYRTVIQYSLQIQDEDVSSGVMSISLFVLFRTISFARNKLLERDISTQTDQLFRGLINEFVNKNYGEIIGPGDFLQITGDVRTVNKMLQTLSYRSPPNGNGNDFITLSAWDNGNSGSGFSNSFRSPSKHCSAKRPASNLHQRNRSRIIVREVGGGSGLHGRKCSLSVGRLQFIEHYKRLLRTRRSPGNKRTIQSQRTIFSGSLPYIVS